MKPETAARIEKIDRLIPDPELRGRRVWEVFKTAPAYDTLSHWDIVCFCIGYLQSLLPMHDWLKHAVIRLSSLVYQAHYFNTEDLGLIGNAEVLTTEFTTQAVAVPEPAPATQEKVGAAHQNLKQNLTGSAVQTNGLQPE